MIKSSRKGMLKGSLITPQATSSDIIHIGRIHWIVNIKTGFPEERSLGSVRATKISPISRSFFSILLSNLLAWPNRSSSNTVFISISPSESRYDPEPKALSICAIEGLLPRRCWFWLPICLLTCLSFNGFFDGEVGEGSFDGEEEGSGDGESLVRDAIVGVEALVME